MKSQDIASSLLVLLLLSGVCSTYARKLKVYTSPLQSNCTIPNARPDHRLFHSDAVENLISSWQDRFIDPNLAQLFANTLPNSLDTTVYSFVNGSATVEADSFLITGDIPAMWLRDSSNQVHPYIALSSTDPTLRQLLVGLINRQSHCILIDSYANAFQLNNEQTPSPNSGDSTSKPAFAGTSVNAMTPALFERKWEVDSLVAFLRLSTDYYLTTSDLSVFSTDLWASAVRRVLETFRSQQLSTAEEDMTAQGPEYLFQRNTGEPTDTLEHARGAVAAHTGMIKSGFRPSDDATTLPFNIPQNAYAVGQLQKVAELLQAVGESSLSQEALAIAQDVSDGIQKFGVFEHKKWGTIYAYEVDGFGNYYFMDDANFPSLLGLPLTGFVNQTDPLYLNTRQAVLSDSNPYYITGQAASGIGGPHNGWYWIWPISFMVESMTTSNVTRITEIVQILLDASACTGLQHESFDHDSFQSYTRPWFAWANSLFAEFIIDIANRYPNIIFN